MEQPPDAATTKATWLQHLLSNFVGLREEAVNAEAQLHCMPVVITASTRASASTMQHTASGNSKTKDLQLWPLTEQESTSIVLICCSALAAAIRQPGCRER